MNKKPAFLFYGSIISLAALALLFALRQYRPLLLDIDVKWLVLAGLPILIALIAGKYISKFKGFGMDIEVAAQEELIDNPSVMTVLHKANVKKKSELNELFAMPEEERASYNVLAFQLHQTDYYDVEAIRQYVTLMRNVKFFEFTDSMGKFVALGKIQRLRFSDTGNWEDIKRFIEKIEQGNLQDSNISVNRKYVCNIDSVIGTLGKIKSSRTDFIAVLDSNNDKNLIGVAYERAIEKFLANAILKSWRKTENS